VQIHVEIVGQTIKTWEMMQKRGRRNIRSDNKDMGDDAKERFNCSNICISISAHSMVRYDLMASS